MNTKHLILTIGAAAMAVTFAASASSETRHTGQPAPVHRTPECVDPGSHIWCAAAPTHLNDAALSAGNG
jgi:hypothetical protein